MENSWKIVSQSKNTCFDLLAKNFKGMKIIIKIHKVLACGLTKNYFSILNLIADEVKFREK